MKHPNYRSDRLTGSARSNDVTPFIKGLLESQDFPLLLRCVVMEVLHDPASLTDEKKSELRERFKSNLDLLDVAPNNSVIVVPARQNNEVLNQPIILYPFFSHMASPMKIGEHVWAMFETDETRELGYWMSRIAENRFVDDQNFTHADRRFSVSSKASTKEKAGQPQDDTVPGFENGLGIPETFSLSQDTGKNAYNELNKTADTAKLHIPEPVPRFRKRPSDYMIAGSNNTMILLGTDRTTIPAQYDDAGNIIGYPDSDETENAGMIDIVVGRGQTDTTSPLTIKNTRDLLEANRNPIATNEDEKLEEGDPDYINDLSRVLISMSTNADAKLRLFDKLPNINAASEEVAPAVVAKSNQLRFIAREDIKIVVAPPGADVDDLSTIEQFASVVIKKNGDIVFAPARQGYVKLGGDHADRAILCTDTPASTVDGVVTSPPLATTMGGLIGNAVNGLGTFSTKVLVVGD